MGKGTPFVGTEAIDAGTFTERELRRFCTRIYPNVYQRRDSGLTAKDRAVAAWLWSGKRAVVAGNSAAALLGAEWVDPHGAAELISDHKRPPPLIVTRNETLLPGETTQVVGVPVTSPARTAFDLGRHARPVAAGDQDQARDHRRGIAQTAESDRGAQRVGCCAGADRHGLGTVARQCRI